VNNVRNDGPELIEPIADAEVAKGGTPTRDAPDPRSPGLFDEAEPEPHEAEPEPDSGG
jgi:hypothetical protein